MRELFIWWFVTQVLGLATLPLAFRLFAGLPDRGYAFARPLGLFIVSYLLWITAILGLLPNTRASILLILIVVAAVSWWPTLQ